MLANLRDEPLLRFPARLERRRARASVFARSRRDRRRAARRDRRRPRLSRSSTRVCTARSSSVRCASSIAGGVALWPSASRAHAVSSTLTALSGSWRSGEVAVRQAHRRVEAARRECARCDASRAPAATPRIIMQAHVFASAPRPSRAGSGARAPDPSRSTSCTRPTSSRRSCAARRARAPA